MASKRIVISAILFFTQASLAADSDCKPHAWDTEFSPMQQRNIVNDLLSLKAEGVIQIDKASQHIGRPDRVKKSDDFSVASWVYGQRRLYDFDDCHGGAYVKYTVAYAVLFLEQARGSNVVCKVREVTFMSEKMRPDPYEERIDVVPQSLSVSSCEKFLSEQQ